MSSSYIEPLNLQYIFQNVLSGSPEIFTALFMIGFSILAGTLRMSPLIYGIMFALATMLLYDWLGGGLFLFIIFFGGLLIFWVISKIIKE